MPVVHFHNTRIERDGFGSLGTVARRLVPHGRYTVPGSGRAGAISWGTVTKV